MRYSVALCSSTKVIKNLYTVLDAILNYDTGISELGQLMDRVGYKIPNIHRGMVPMWIGLLGYLVGEGFSTAHCACGGLIVGVKVIDTNTLVLDVFYTNGTPVWFINKLRQDSVITDSCITRGE